MLNYYTTKNNTFQALTEAEEGCWISMIDPSDAEVTLVSDRYTIYPETVRAALDTDERSRIESDETYTMVLVNIPTVEEHNDKELYNTIPLSVIVTKEAVITVCSLDTPLIKQFAENRVRDFRTNMKSRFILQILYRTASMYLQYLRSIDRKTDQIESKLSRSTQNRELIELLKLEKSLLYFSTSLRSNETVLEKLFKNELVKKYPEDEDLLEDVIVENKQAMEMASIYSGVLNGMMEAFGSVISNNLNIVMKLLAIITIVMSIPTIIFSAYGMNLNPAGMPFSATPYGFAIVIVLTVVLSVAVTLIFVKMKIFK